MFLVICSHLHFELWITMTGASWQLIFPCLSPLYIVDGNWSTKVIFKSFWCLVMGITINQKRKGVEEGCWDHNSNWGGYSAVYMICKLKRKKIFFQEKLPKLWSAWTPFSPVGSLVLDTFETLWNLKSTGTDGLWFQKYWECKTLCMMAECDLDCVKYSGSMLIYLDSWGFFAERSSC